MANELDLKICATESDVPSGVPDKDQIILVGGESDGGGSAPAIYDLVITTQAEFNAMVSSSTWLDAKSVAIIGGGGAGADGEYLYGESATGGVQSTTGIKIPQTVVQIHGFGGAAIKVTNFTYSDTTAKAGLWYDTQPSSELCEMSGLSIYCSGSSGISNFKNVVNCRISVGLSLVTTAYANRGTNCSFTRCFFGPYPGFLGIASGNFGANCNFVDCTLTGCGAGANSGDGCTFTNCRLIDDSSNTDNYGNKGNNCIFTNCRLIGVGGLNGQGSSGNRCAFVNCVLIGRSNHSSGAARGGTGKNNTFDSCVLIAQTLTGNNAIGILSTNTDATTYHKIINCTFPLGTKDGYNSTPANVKGIDISTSTNIGAVITGNVIHSGFTEKITAPAATASKVEIANNVTAISITQAVD